MQALEALTREAANLAAGEDDVIASLAGDEFKLKEALFNALAEPHATALMGKFMEAQISFAELPEEQAEQMPKHLH